MDIVNKMIQFETEGFDTEDELVDFFQELIDTGMVWSLQGSYGRAASDLIDAGYCHA